MDQKAVVTANRPIGPAAVCWECAGERDAQMSLAKEKQFKCPQYVVIHFRKREKSRNKTQSKIITTIVIHSF
jgi:hypothetical protein